MKRIAILASGSGSNAEAIIHYLRQSREAEVVLLLTNRPDAGVRERARRLGVRCDYLPTAELRKGSKPLALLAELGVELVVLAGYLVLITEPWLQAYPQRILNIHPALLPEFGGKGMYGHHVHEAVLAAGRPYSGITIHLVDEHYDHGQTLLQAQCPVLPGDSPETLAARIHQLEHRYYPAAVAQYLRLLDER